MSIEYCYIHDREYDTDFVEMCPQCELKGYLHDNVRKLVEKYRNMERLAAYKRRRAEFIEKYSQTPDKEYEAFYGAEMAGYIDARQWWEHLNEDQDYINQQENYDEH